MSITINKQDGARNTKKLMPDWKDLWTEV